MAIEISDLKDYLISLFLARRMSCLLIGASGIGKSVGVEETAQSIAAIMNREFIDFTDNDAQKVLENPDKYFLYVDLRLTEQEPSDLQGIPKDARLPKHLGRGITYDQFLWALCLSKCPGILFLDEITNVARDDVRAAAYKIVQDKRVGFIKFTKDVMVVAAGNAPKHSSIANLLPAPLVNRLNVVELKESNLVSWSEWMDAHFSDWDRKVLGYLTMFPQSFLRMPEENETLTNFPTPRSWMYVATTNTHMPDHFRETYITGEVGNVAGREFMAFIRARIDNLDLYMRDPKKFSSLDLDGKYLLCIASGNWMRDNADGQIDKIIPLLTVMGNERKEFLTVAVISSGNRRMDVILKLMVDPTLKKWLKQISEKRFAVGGSK